MGTMKYKGKSYEVDSNNFLVDYNNWDKDFVKGMAQRLGMAEDLAKEQWDVINFIRNSYKETGICPNVYETCRICNLRAHELWTLFPNGYLRGACKLSGISYKEG
ncbi:TusE/DsrC/DsvC family sulfur relay protein [Chloroflexota bacterium]